MVSNGFQIDAALRALYADLQAPVEASGGKLYVAQDENHAINTVLDILCNAARPGGLSVVIVWQGRDASDNAFGCPFPRTRIGVYAVGEFGRPIEPGLALMNPPDDDPDRAPWLRQVSDLHRRVLTLAWPPEVSDIYPRDEGCKPISTPDGLPLAAYQIAFSLAIVPPGSLATRGGGELTDERKQALAEAGWRFVTDL